jgi:hypothetical protein
MDDEPKRPFCVIVIDEAMIDDRPWKSAVRKARDRQHRIVCGAAGVDRDALAAEFSRTHKLAGVP